MRPVNSQTLPAGQATGLYKPKSGQMNPTGQDKQAFIPLLGANLPGRHCVKLLLFRIDISVPFGATLVQPVEEKLQ